VIAAIKASGVIVIVEPEEFVGILKRQPGALVVHATGGFFSTSYRYLTSYKGLAFYTEARAPLDLPPGHGVGAGQEDLGAGRVAPNRAPQPTGAAHRLVQSSSSPGRPGGGPGSFGEGNVPPYNSRCLEHGCVGASACNPERPWSHEYSLQEELSVNARFTGMVSSVSCLFLASAVVGGEPVAKPVKKTIRADDGLNLVCEVRGQGDTALVFLHGWCGDREYWKHQADAFAGDYRVVTIDQAGHGESGKDRKVWSASGLAGDVEAVVKALGLKRVILVGHSMGGPVALLAAKRMPGTVVAVIGVDTLQNVEFKIPEDVRKQFMEAFEKDFKGTMQMGLNGMLPEATDAGLKQWLVTRAQAQDPTMAMGLMRDLSGLDTKKLLAEARVPVRCINSAGGFQFFTPTAVEVNKKYADFNAVTIEGVGHYPMLEKPAEFNQKLRDVLQEVAAKK
jgi:pimeloyl-ACP methyl ester carboxylesterase